LENRDGKIVVTSLINNTFPIIRYQMEDIGTIVNKNGKQYITNLIGKNTNQIIINDKRFTSLDVDKLISHVNLSNNIIAIILEYTQHVIDVNYIVLARFSENNENIVRNKTIQFMTSYFENNTYNVNFLLDYDHNYLKKFKIIVKRDKTDDEPVGGYFKHTNGEI
jgi:phenylacetate-coenzyme A ligase PaaK-like adenylate-forming protein